MSAENPTPWRQVEDQPKLIEDALEQLVVEVCHPADTEAQALAEQICRVVNAHETLVRECRRALSSDALDEDIRKGLLNALKKAGA